MTAGWTQSRIRLLAPMTRRVLRSVGQCVYCGSSDDLRNEHVIPFALGGRDELHSATCGACADRTSAFEQRIARSPALWPLRRALQLRSRRKRRQPNAFPVRLGSGASSQDAEVSVDRFPLLVPFFVFDPPSGSRESAGPPVGRLLIWKARPLEAAPAMTIPLDLTAEDIARLIAKIGLGYAMAAYGPSEFVEVFVRELVLGDTASASAWVGGWTGPPNMTDAKVHSARTFIDDASLVHVVVQLFRPPTALSQTPAYHVIVGRVGAVAAS